MKISKSLREKELFFVVFFKGPLKVKIICLVVSVGDNLKAKFHILYHKNIEK